MEALAAENLGIWKFPMLNAALGNFAVLSFSLLVRRFASRRRNSRRPLPDFCFRSRPRRDARSREFLGAHVPRPNRLEANKNPHGACLEFSCFTLGFLGSLVELLCPFWSDQLRKSRQFFFRAFHWPEVGPAPRLVFASRSGMRVPFFSMVVRTLRIFQRAALALWLNRLRPTCAVKGSGPEIATKKHPRRGCLPKALRARLQPASRSR